MNDGVLKSTYLGTDFQLHYPLVDTIIRHLNALGPWGKYLYDRYQSCFLAIQGLILVILTS